MRYSQAIVNAGREAGASIEHPHAQLLGMSFVPRELAEEQAGFARFTGRCLLCTAIDAEESTGYRVVYSDERVAVVCPFWSGTPYEMLVIPRTHGPHLHRAATADLVSVGRAMRGALASLQDHIGDVPYNLVFHSAPFRAPEPFHWHVHITAEAHHPGRVRARNRRAHQHRAARAGRRRAPDRTAAAGVPRLSRHRLSRHRLSATG